MRFIPAILASMLAAGCTSMQSSVATSGQPAQDGLAYFLPRRPILVKVVVSDDGKKRTPSVDAGDNEPDTGREFVLSYLSNLLGKNAVNLMVSPAGLLTSTKASVESQVSDAAKALGTLAGKVTGIAAAAAPVRIRPTPVPEPVCSPGQTYVRVVQPGEPVDTRPLCGFSIKVERMVALPNQLTSRRETERAQDVAGVFYRRDLPYRVLMEDSTGERQFVAYSPNESPTYYFPIGRSLFADSSATLTFSSPGVLTGVEQSADGELTALVKLPADVIDAYFSAIGGLFSQIGTNRDNEADAIKNQQSLLLARAKQQLCATTIAANPIAGKTPDEAARAITAIKSACE